VDDKVVCPQAQCFKESIEFVASHCVAG
jgi:hypothetical protein